jgi:hypothetical protein
MGGGVAQLVEHLVCNQAVVGSNPVASTTCLRCSIRCPRPSSSRESFSLVVDPRGRLLGDL